AKCFGDTKPLWARDIRFRVLVLEIAHAPSKLVHTLRQYVGLVFEVANSAFLFREFRTACHDFVNAHFSLLETRTAPMTSDAAQLVDVLRVLFRNASHYGRTGSL